MTAKDPFEEDFLNLPQPSDGEEPGQKIGHPEHAQPAAGPGKELKLRRFDEEAFLDVPDLKAPPPDTVELKSEEEPPPKRPLPGIIDIFLYPFGRAGIATLAIMLGTPMVLIMVALGCVWLCQVIPILLLIAVPIAIGALLVALGMVLYFGWYVCECVRDSAAGGIRAPDTMGETPGLMEMGGQNFQLLVCVGVCGGLYSSTVKLLPADSVASWILLGLIAFLFPMTLLRVIMSESLQGLIPLMTLRLIGRTCVRYLVLLSGLCVLPVLGYWLFQELQGWFLLVALLAYGIYVCLVSAHLLGRFAWHCEDRLEWE